MVHKRKLLRREWIATIIENARSACANGGLSQVAVTETVHAGVLKVDGDSENAKRKILVKGKTRGTKKVKR